MLKMRCLVVPVLALAAAVVVAGCHKRPVDVHKEPALPEPKVAKKMEGVPEKKAVLKPAVLDPKHLFTITRSQNRNEVIYEARRTANGFDTQDPIKVYWIMVEDGGKTEDLNALEKRAAYGVSVVSATEKKVVFNLKALEDRKIEVTFDEKRNRSLAVMPINGEACELDSVYINARPRKLNPVPEVLNIDISGRSVVSGEPVREVVKP